MVNPIYIVAVLLGTAFLLGFFNSPDLKLVRIIAFISLAFPVFVSLEWLVHFLSGASGAVQIFTAGTTPPFSINLRMGMQEAFMSSAVNLLGVFGFLYMFREFKNHGVRSVILFITLIMGLNVIILSRDIFNIFVFLEIASIALTGLIYLKNSNNSSVAGFKYLIAVSVISSFLLIGTGFFYLFSGTLNIDDFAGRHLLGVKGLSIAVFMIIISVLLELKPFPANGWALDVYQSANPGISAMISSGTASASLFLLYKLLPLDTGIWHGILAGIGIFTFIGSNLLGIAQKNANRLLGYSSVGQIGLLVAVIGFEPMLKEYFNLVFFTLFISHFLAKAGLFWLSGIVKKEGISEWALLRKNKILVFLFGLFVFTLIGFPPLPSFYGKWQLVMTFAHQQSFAWIILILLGSFFEGMYLFRWLGSVLKEAFNEDEDLHPGLEQLIPPVVFAMALLAASYFANSISVLGTSINLIPLYFILFLFIVDFLPAFVKNTLSILAIAGYAVYLYPFLEHDMLRLIFGVIFVAGGILTLFAGYSVKGRRPGFYPFAIMMYAGLLGLLQAENLFQFFFAWELMTLGSYILIIRGRRSMKHALNYMLFSLGGAYLILVAFALSFSGQDNFSLSILADSPFPTWTYALLAIGFMTKTAALGLHIWLPGAHAEAESDVSPMVSGILLKAGVFGLIILFLAMGGERAGNNPLIYALGWLGALTALGGNLLAVFQEDAKRLLAYSSVGNLGYILFALAFMTNVGWMTALTYSLNHFMFKTLLFLAIGGVVLRVKTHNMYEMGGLIKQMPFSFIAVLIGIITLAGIPPLSGYAGKWLFYNAVISKGWYFQGAIVFFAGTIAFLYCFKLIYSVFLGQSKDRFRKVREVPFWYIIPQVILILGIMVFSARPDLVLKPIGQMLARADFFPTDPLTWENVTATTNLGYWSGFKIMMVIGIMFVVLLGWLLLMSRKAQKIKQFNMVYAGERPFTPESTHFSHNMFAHYFKAIGFLSAPVATKFWNGVDQSAHSLAGFIRRIYTGDGQTYLAHIMVYIILVYLLMF